MNFIAYILVYEIEREINPGRHEIDSIQ